MSPLETITIRPKKIKDATGSVFGKLTIIKFSHAKKKRPHGWQYFWECQCECGNAATVDFWKLRLGHTKSCGCLHSGGRAIERHGHHNSPTYSTWEHMINRCRPQYFKAHLYHQQGVSVCERWRSFTNFLADMGERPNRRHTIDRWPDNNGNYEPGNCRWATYSQQNSNLRPRKRRVA